MKPKIPGNTDECFICHSPLVCVDKSSAKYGQRYTWCDLGTENAHYRYDQQLDKTFCNSATTPRPTNKPTVKQETLSAVITRVERLESIVEGLK